MCRNLCSLAFHSGSYVAYNFHHTREPCGAMRKAAPLATLRRAALGWPGCASASGKRVVDLTIGPASHGGIALLGSNGTGKTLIGSALAGSDGHTDDDWLRSGTFERRDGWSRRSASQVSFESHESLLTEGGTVYRALGIPPGATPSKAAKYLILRFGLHPLLYRPVTAISTGEIRKVLLARALATRPSLLVLDNAFDGLDVPSRVALAELISLTLRGFSQLLVQGVDASATAHTQVLLITHRPEEIVNEISTVAVLSPDAEGGTLSTHARDGRTAESLMQLAMGEGTDRRGFRGEMAVHGPPAHDEVLSALGTRGAPGTPLVEAKHLRVQRGDGSTDGSATPAVLLSGLEWRVRRGEHWLIAGGNGAGKSTLSALLARADAQSLGASGDFRILGEALGMSPTCPATSSVADQARPLLPRDGVGWVSTELHLSMARSSRLAIDVLQGFRMPGSKADELSLQVARWLGLSAAAVLQRPFSMLSQGEQKLVLIGAAIAKRPELLVLDEPCQGLDTVHRTRVLSLVNRVCSVSNTTLIYITHHYEEVLPCVSHVMHLQQGQAIFTGDRKAYEESSGLPAVLSSLAQHAAG